METHKKGHKDGAREADNTGDEKKNYVLRCAKNFALSEDVEFNEREANKTIEKLIKFSKGVNERKKRVNRPKKES